MGNKLKTFNKKFREKYSDKFLLRLVTSYSLFLIIILVLGVFTYNFAINSAKSNLVKENNNILENAVTEVEKSFKIMLSLNFQIANNTEIAKFVDAKNQNIGSSFFLNVMKARNNLTNLLSVQNLTFIDNIFIYAHNTDYILSASEIEKSSLYYHYNRRYNGFYYKDFLETIMNTENAGKPQQLDKYSNTRDDFLLYTYPMSMYRVGAIYPATICYTINKNYFEHIFSDLSLYNTGLIYVTDKEGNEILKITTPDSIEIPIEEIHRFNASEKDELTITHNGQNLIISTYTSNSNNWIYYLIQPSAMVFYNLNDYQNIYITIIFIALVIGLLLLFVLSHNNVMPFKQIEGRLENCFTDDDNLLAYKSNDVRNSIDHYINVLIDKKATMQQMLEWQRPIVYNASLSKLMNGLASTSEELKLITKTLNIHSQDSNFSILYVNVCLNELDFYIDDSIRSKGGYQKVIKEVFYHYFGESIYIYEVDANSFSILLQWGSDTKDFIEQIQELFTNVRNELKNKYSLVIYGGLSDTYTDLLLTWQAYQQSIEAYNYACRNNNLQLYNCITKNMNNYYYPLELEQQLVSFIMNGKQSQVKVILENLHTENFINRSLPITMIKWLLSDLRNTLLKVRFTIPINTNNNIKFLDIDNKFQQKKSFELIETIAYDLCSLFESKSTSNVLIDKIQEYIKSNYMDSSLSLCKISEQFHISESYFSYLFKEVTNENFSEYLEKIRIDKAYKLLQQTSMTIIDIAKKVGYNNSASFRRAFKRICKITPVEVRTVNKLLANQDV